MNERKFILSAIFISTFVIIASTSALAFDPDANYSVTNKSSSITGITITQKVPFSKESLNEIKERESMQPAPIQKKREIPFHKAPPPEDPVFKYGDYGNQSPENNTPNSLIHEFAPSPLASALSNSFSGLSDDDTVIPPDTNGAAGPMHLMEPLNSQVGFFDKSTGALISNTSLRAFWSSLGQPADDPFDPKVIYDQHSGRFILVTVGGTSSPNSWLMLAVSATSDPTGNWSKWAIDADKDGGVQTNNWADYPGIGVDANYVYVTANMFNNSDYFKYSKVWVLPKTQLLNGNASITWIEFRNPPGSGFTMQPANVFGSSSTEYLIHEGYYNPGTPPRRFLRISNITFPGGTPTWTNLGYIEVSSYPVLDFPGAPQNGSSDLIDTGDARLLNAVYRNGYLWTTHTVANNANSKTEVAWYQINPAQASPSSPGLPAQQGRISDANRWYYYYPSIAVNAKGDVGIGFSGSSTSEYAGAYYTARNSSDTAGTMQSVALLKAGLAPYNKTFGGARNRWGDYSATVVDPNDDTTFWTIQEYANTHVVDDLWGTWWGKFALSAKNQAAMFNISGYKINGSDGSGIAGWNITLTNASLNVTASTNASGFYRFTGLVNGTYNITEETKTGFTNVTLRQRVVTISGNDSTNVNFTNKRILSAVTFDTGSGSYPSIMGTHNGTLRLKQSLTITRMYTYPSPGTGGHSEYAALYRNGTLLASGSWSGYSSDWHNITFAPLTLEANVTYNYTIRTGSYPQIIHKPSHTTPDESIITGSEFIDANGRRYSDWIPAIRLE